MKTENLSKEELIARVHELEKKCSSQLELLDSWEFFKLFDENVDDLIFVIQQNGSITYINNAGKELLPFPREQVIRKHFTECIPDKLKARAEAAFNSVINEGKEFRSDKFEAYTKGGDPAFLTVHFHPIKAEDGTVQGLYGRIKNITELHSIEKRLNKYSKHLKVKAKEHKIQSDELTSLRELNEEIIKNAPLGICIIEPTGIIISENPALKEIIGLSPEGTLIGINLLENQGFIEAGLENIIDQIMNEKEQVKLKNVKYTPFPDSELLFININMMPLFDNKRKVKTILIIVEDITEQAKMDKILNKTEQLAGMRTLATGLAYELKVPVNLIKIDVNYIQKNIDEHDPMLDYLESIGNEIERLEKTISQLLNLSKPLEDKMEHFELSSLLSVYPIKLSFDRLQKSGYKVTTSVTGKPPPVYAIKRQLVEVLLQLISNSEDAMPEPGLLRIDISSIKQDNIHYAALAIEDSGTGISEDEMKKIFQPFYTTKGEKSSGLGLVVSYSIIENLNGIIGIKSTPEEGTRVKILIPAPPAVEEPEAKQ